MRKQFKKLISAFVIIAYVVSIMTSAVYAAPSDITGHAAASVINKWISKGLAEVQPDGKFRPNEILKRIEFITFVNKVFNFTEKANINIVDVIASSDDGGEVAKAVAAGYLQGDSKKKVYPYQPITKTDAALMLAKVFDLSTGNISVFSRFSDSGSLSISIKETISALVEKGYITGGSDGKFSPWSNLTRAEAIVIIDRIMGNLFNAQGTYKGQLKGNVVINKRNIILKDATIEGDLYLVEGIGDGDVTLDKVTVKGRTYVRGGGKHSIVIRNSALWGPVSVKKKDGLVRLVAEGTTNVYNVQLNSGAILEENSIKTSTGYKGFDEVQVNSGITKNQEVKFEGDFSSVDIAAASINVQVDGDVSKFQIKESAENSNIKVRSGAINEFNLKADKAILDLTGGTVTTLSVSGSASASTITVNGASIGTLSVGASSKVEVAKGSVDSLSMLSGASGSTVTIAKNARVTNFINAPGVGVTDNRSTGNGTSTTQYISINAQSLSVTKDNVAASIVNVSPVDAVLNYTSLNPTVATVNPNNGVVTGVNIGTATILVSASKTGYTSSSTTFSITVNALNTNATAAGNLILAPVSANRDTSQTITLSYTPGEALSNGTVVFNLPTGFTAGTDDEYSIIGGSTPTSAVKLRADQITNSGQTVTLLGMTTSSTQTIVLSLFNTAIPAPNTYTFSATADADGTGVRAPSTGTGNEVKTFTSNSVSVTLPGTLAIAPASVAAGSIQDITLTYTPGENLSNGSVVFTLPSGFTPNANNDVVSINNVTSSAVTIVGQVVTITGVTATTGQNVVLLLKEKTIPAAGSYDFKVVADADGVGGTKSPSLGIAPGELKSLTSATSNAPSVTAATNATVDNDFSLTFTDNPTWRNGITVITVNGTALSSSAYDTTTAGSITLKPLNDSSNEKLLKTPGTKQITIVSTNFANVTVNQIIKHGAAAKIVITTQPTAPAANGGSLAAQPKLKLQDKYDNDCTSDNSTVVTVDNNSANNWILGGTTTKAAIDGVVEFAGLTASAQAQVSNARLRFSGVGTEVLSSTFNIGAPSIVLTPAANATVDGSFSISCTDNASWRGAIISISVDGTAINNSSGVYTVSGSSITFDPSKSTLLQTTGNKNIVITATGYQQVSLTQNIKHGNAVKLLLQAQPQPPSANGTLLTVQPVVAIADQYGNTCSSNNTIQVLALKGDGGTWTLGGTTTKSAINGIVSFTNLSTVRNAEVSNAYIRFTSGSLTSVNSNTFTILANSGNETAAITSPASNSYSNTNVTTVSGTATNTNSDIVKVIVRIKDNAKGKYLSANNGGFTSDSAVDLTVVGTTSWSVTLSGVNFTTGNYTVEAIANDGADGLMSTSVFTIDKAAPYRINVNTTQQNIIPGNNGYITLTTVNDPLSNTSWTNILNEITSNTAITAGSWISGIDSSYLDIDPAPDGISARLINKDASNATIVSDFVIPAAMVVDRAGNIAAGNITVDSFIAQPPTFVSAATDISGGTITITFNKAMTSPAGMHGQFLVTVNGVDVPVTNAALNANTSKIDLTIDTSSVTIAYGQPITVTYTAGTVTSSDTGILASFLSKPVSNNVPIGAPVFQSASTNTNGDKVIISFDKNMGDPSGKHAQFSVIVDDVSVETSGAVLNTDLKKIEITIATKILYGQTVEVNYTAGTVKAADNGVLASFPSAKVVSNIVPLPAAPTVISAATTTDGTKIEVKFSRAMANPSIDQGGSFVVNDGAANAVTAISLKSGDSTIIVLTLTNTITFGKTVTVSYTKGTIKAADRGVLENFSQNVTNTVGVPAPTVSSATTSMDGTKVEITFNKAMANPAADASNFTVNNGSNINVTAAMLKTGDNFTIVLSLATPIANGQTVKVSYTPGSVKASDNGVLGSVTDYSVSNIVPLPTAPLFVSAATTTDGTKVEVKFDKSIADPAGNSTGFSVSVGGSNNVITSIALKSGDATTIVLTLTTAVIHDQIVTVAYSPGSIKSVQNVALGTILTQTVTNNVPAQNPTFVSAETTVDGTQVEVKFNKLMADPSTNAAKFIVNNGSINTVKTAALKIGDNTIIVLTLTTPIAGGQNVTVAYSGGTVKSADNGVLAAFAAQTVVNNVIASAKIISVSSSTINGTYGVGQDISIKVTFDTRIQVTGGIPTLRLETGTIDQEATYVSIDGTETILTFNYTIRQGDNASDLEYVNTTSLALNGATIKNKDADVNAVLTLPALNSIYSLGGQKGIIIDTTAPVNASGFHKAGTKTETTANVLVQTNENGKAYYVVLESGSSSPTTTQIKAGKDASNLDVAKKGSADITAGTQTTISITGLTMLTAYDIYVACEDSVSNLQSAPVKIPVTTTNDITPPAFADGFPDKSVAGTAAVIYVQTDEAGKAYYIVKAAGTAAPTSAQVKANTGSLSESFKGVIDIVDNTGIFSGNINLTGLNGLTTYDVYVVCEDGNNNLQATPAKVQVTTDLTGVTVDVAAGKLNNTSSRMDFSLDSTNGTNGTWSGCTDGSTSVQFTVGAVYIRDRNDFSTVRNVITITQQPKPTDDQMNSIGYNIAAGTISGVIDSMQYRINGGSWTNIITSGAISGINFVAGDLEFRIKATQTTLASLPVKKVTISAPSSQPMLVYDDIANTISGLNSVDEYGVFIYEYKIDTGAWTSGVVIPDLSGTNVVYVRLKATATSLPSQIQIINFTSNINLDTVGINVAAGQIYGTTTAMEYSLDSTDGFNGIWKTCTNTNTNVTFVEGKVYIRASAQRENVRWIDTIAAPAAPEGIGANETGGQNAVKLVNTTTSMQYSRNGGASWFDITATIASGTQSIDVSTVPNNDLRVRNKATATTLASLPTGKLNNTGTITVSQQTALTATVVGANQTVQLSDLWKLTVAKENVVLSSIIVDLSGTVDTANLDNITLMYSTDATIGNGDDTVGGIINPATGAAELNFTSLSKNVTAGSIYIYVTGQISSSAVSGENVALSITAGAISATGAVSAKVISSTGSDTGTTVTLDNTPPTAAITYSINHAVKVGDTLIITATFNKAMANAPIVQIGISEANTLALTNMTRVDSTHYTYTHTVGTGNGDATITLATGTDLSGNVISGITAGDKFTVDNTAPVAPVNISRIPNGGIISNSDYINSSNTHLRVTANITAGDAAGGTAELLEGGLPLGTPVMVTSIDEDDTSVSFLVTRSAISQGPKTFTIRLTDAAGNSTTSIANATITADYTAPSAPTGIAATAVGGTVVTGYVNASNTQVDITANITAEEAAGGKAELMIGNAILIPEVQSSINSSDSSVLLTINRAAIPVGSHNFAIKLTDAAGNSVTSAAITLVADFTVPNAPTGVSIRGNNSTTIANCVNSTNAQVIAAATITAGQATGGYAELLIDGLPFGTPIKDLSINSSDTSVSFLSSFAAQINLRDAIPAGNHTIAVRLTDAAGNTVTSEETPFVADYTSPSDPSNVTVDVTGGTIVPGYINSSNTGLSISADIISGQAAGGKAELLINGYSFDTPVYDNTIDEFDTHVTFTVPRASIPQGTTPYRFTVKLITVTGNTAVSAPTPPITADYTAPTAPSGLVLTPIGGIYMKQGYVNTLNTDISVSGVIVAGQATGGSAKLKIDNAFFVIDDTINEGDTTITLTTDFGSALELQNAIHEEKGYIIEIWLTDAAGNSSASSPISLIADYTLPSTPTAISIGASGGTVEAGKINATNMYVKVNTVTIVAGQATGGRAELIMDYGIPGARVIATDNIINATDTTLTLSSNFANPAALQAAIPEGAHTFRIVLTDAAGNLRVSGATTLTADY